MTSLLAIADDLTGAAEIAAVGHRVGWRAEVITRWSEPRDGVLTVQRLLKNNPREVTLADAEQIYRDAF